MKSENRFSKKNQEKDSGFHYLELGEEKYGETLSLYVIVEILVL